MKERNLRRVNLEGADLLFARLVGAFLDGANLKGAELIRADLLWTRLRGVDFEGADLRKANFKETKLKGAKNLTIDQLSKVKTLYYAELDEELEVPLREKYPALFENPDKEE
ncbi:pentapeptide repeat-containing protein [Methanosarcina sp.]|uniref:pentapeptide repeat-containing protein n=1 Tax=Methanosarcina sp. TaxID=2213 RepID=UPI002ABBCE1D|nr:pentapeptide repeat-containing protein [Methanosarcina sp.]MDY9925312.1 pentapeptide repeat-containing protein [Methanosarcina sp.]